MSSTPTAEQLDIRRKGRQRLIGAIALALAAVVFVPMLLDPEPRRERVEPILAIPAKDAVPLPEAAKAAPRAVAPAAPAVAEVPSPAAAPAPAAVPALPTQEERPSSPRPGSSRRRPRRRRNRRRPLRSSRASPFRSARSRKMRSLRRPARRSLRRAWPITRSGSTGHPRNSPACARGRFRPASRRKRPPRSSSARDSTHRW